MEEILFSTPQMAATFSAQANLAAMLRFEAALARAEAHAGLIPPSAASAIEAACQVELFQEGEIFQKAVTAGTPAIPLVRRLTELVEGEAARFVHLGATSQDVIDTALMLQMQTGLGLIEADLLGVAAACAGLAERHRATLMVGRTLLQQALPITFGLKAARWLNLVTRQIGAVRERQKSSLAVQFGGAAGTLAALGEHGLSVARQLADELALPAPDLPWHTERDRVAEIAANLGITAGAMSKIASDLILLTQSEVGEVAEGQAEGKGGSSAMPHKRNPVDTTQARAAARLALGLVPTILNGMEQEQERAAGNWQAEWVALPALFRYTAKAVASTRVALEGLTPDPARMQSNLDLTHGLIMAESLTTALAVRLGRPAAFRLVEDLSRRVNATGQSLNEVAADDPQVKTALTANELAQALDPASYLGSTAELIDRALIAYRQL